MNARLKFRLIMAAAQTPQRAGLWPRSLGKPIDPMANVLAYRAHSILHDMDVREPRGLSVSEASDVLRWSGQPI
jgi:hypothetical protein